MSNIISLGIIAVEDLASYLRSPALADDQSFAHVVALTNELITDAWANPTTPAPIKVRLLAIDVASRAWSWDPATANLESVSRSLDDASRTERYRSLGEAGRVYLTASEAAFLQGRGRTRSVRLVQAGDLP